LFAEFAYYYGIAYSVKLRGLHHLPEEPAEGNMSNENETIYSRLFADLFQTSLRNSVGVSPADVRQLADELLEKVTKFNKGMIPENEAADFARKIHTDTFEYIARARDELKLLKEEKIDPAQYFRKEEEEKEIEKLSEKERNAMLSVMQSGYEDIYQLQVCGVESLIAELTRVQKETVLVILHIQEFANTPQYRNLRTAFLLTGEVLKKPTPNTQPLERTPEQIRDAMMKAGLCILKPQRSIKGHEVAAEYWQAKGTTIKNLQDWLSENATEINADTFLRNYLKTKTGKDFADSLRTQKSLKNPKRKRNTQTKKRNRTSTNLDHDILQSRKSVNNRK
jgi:hypothetical protein